MLARLASLVAEVVGRRMTWEHAALSSPPFHLQTWVTEASSAMAISSLSLGVFTVTLMIVPSEASVLLLLLFPGSAAPWSAIFTPPMEQLTTGVSFRVKRGQTCFQKKSKEFTFVRGDSHSLTSQGPLFRNNLSPFAPKSLRATCCFKEKHLLSVDITECFYSSNFRDKRTMLTSKI